MPIRKYRIMERMDVVIVNMSDTFEVYAIPKARHFDIISNSKKQSTHNRNKLTPVFSSLKIRLTHT